MKCLLGKLRTRVSVFSEGGMLGGQAIDTLVETWAGMVPKFVIDTRQSLSITTISSSSANDLKRYIRRQNRRAEDKAADFLIAF
jgi:hypothetical protein